jgi:urease accessory protein UreE
MSEMPTRRQVRTAHERRARLIAQMHRQAMEAAHNLLNQHQAIENSLSKVAKDARRRRAKVIVGAFVVALGCILALLAMMLA